MEIVDEAVILLPGCILRKTSKALVTTVITWLRWGIRGHGRDVAWRDAEGDLIEAASLLILSNVKPTVVRRAALDMGTQRTRIYALVGVLSSDNSIDVATL